MIRELYIMEPLNEIKYCIISLAGRGNSIDDMLQITQSLELQNTLIVVMRPQHYAWYPAPKSPRLQHEAVQGLPQAVKQVSNKIDKIKSMYNINANQIILLGFSAGAVVGLQVALSSPNPYLSMICLSGAILEPNKVLMNKNQFTKYILQHNKDDDCFDWNERYLPMKESLLKNKYNIATIENKYGNHRVTLEDMLAISNYLSEDVNKTTAHSQKDKLIPSCISVL